MDPAQHPQTALETFWRETFEGDTALAANLVYMPSEISVRGVSRQKFAQNLRQCLQNIQTHVQNQTPKPAIRVEIPDVRASAEQLTAHVYISLDDKEDHSMVIPMLKTMSGWRIDSYDALKCQEQPYAPEKAVKIFAEALMNDDLDTAILYVQPNDFYLKVLEKKASQKPPIGRKPERAFFIGKNDYGKAACATTSCTTKQKSIPTKRK